MDILVLDGPTKYIREKMQESGAKEWSRYLRRIFNPIGRGILYTLPITYTGELLVILYSNEITLECIGEDKGYLKVTKAYDTNILEYHEAIEQGRIYEDVITFVPIHKFQYMSHKAYDDVAYFIRIREQVYTLPKETEEETLYHNLLKRLDNDSYKHYQSEVEALNHEYNLQQKVMNVLTHGLDILDLLEETETEKEAIKQLILELKEQKKAYRQSLTFYYTLPEAKHQLMQQIKHHLSQKSTSYEDLLWLATHEKALDFQEYRTLILDYDQSIHFFQENLEIYQTIQLENNQTKEKIKALETELLTKRRLHLNQEALKTFNDQFQNEEITETVEAQIQTLEKELQKLYETQSEKKEGIITTHYLDELKETLYELKEKVEVYIEMHRTVLNELLETITKGNVIKLFKKLETSYQFCQQEGILLKDLEDIESYFELDAIAKKEEQIDLQIEKEKENKEALSQKQEDLAKLLQVKFEDEDVQTYLADIQDGRLYVRQVLDHLMDIRSKQILLKLQNLIMQRADTLKAKQDEILSQNKYFKLKWAFKEELMRKVEA